MKKNLSIDFELNSELYSVLSKNIYKDILEKRKEIAILSRKRRICFSKLMESNLFFLNSPLNLYSSLHLESAMGE